MNDLNSVFLVGKVEKVDSDYLKILNYRHNTDDSGRISVETERFQVKLNKYARKWINKVLPGNVPGTRIGINGRLATEGDRVYVLPFSLQKLDRAGA